MRKTRNLLGGTFMAIPTICGICAVMKGMWWLIPVSIVLIFLLVGINPICRELEAIWVFVMSFFTLVPITGYLLLKFLVISSLAEMLQTLMYLFLLMSAEVLLMTVISAVVWPVKKERRR